MHQGKFDHRTQTNPLFTVFVCVRSVRLNERKQRGVEDNKKLAYLIDIKTIAVGKNVWLDDVIRTEWGAFTFHLKRLIPNVL